MLNIFKTTFMNCRFLFYLLSILFFLNACGEGIDYTNPKKTPLHIHHEGDGHNHHTSDTDSFQKLVSNYEEPNREKWQKPNDLLGGISDLSDKVIADIGAGSGYFTFRLAPRVKKVIAVDIDKRFLNYIDEKKKEVPELADKIETRLAKKKDPNLNPQEVDFVLIVNTYTYLKKREQYFKNLRNAFTLQGQLIIIDYKKEIPKGEPGSNIEDRMAAIEIVKELKKAGYSNIHIDDEALEFQYIITADLL